MKTPEILYDVNLHVLPVEYLQGTWQVTINFPGPAPQTIWQQATALTFSAHTWTLAASDTTWHGTWWAERGTTRSQPILHFSTGSTEPPTQALVTRYRHSHNGQQRRLVLYFQSGLEIELTHP